MCTYDAYTVGDGGGGGVFLISRVFGYPFGRGRCVPGIKYLRDPVVYDVYKPLRLCRTNDLKPKWPNSKVSAKVSTIFFFFFYYYSVKLCSKTSNDGKPKAVNVY